MSRFNQVKEKEKNYWDSHRKNVSERIITAENVQNEVLKPFYEGGLDKYSCNKIAFHQLLDCSWEDKHVLDYACGSGLWAVYYALTGAKKVSGFDLSEASIEAAVQRMKRQNLDSVSDLRPMDAANLQYPDNTFDIVIGHGALHHVIKYPNIFPELYRVMKPGTSAWFLENLADFWPWKLYWKLKGEVEQGDVPIFTKEIREKAHQFSEVQITGDTLFYSIKMLWRKKPGVIGNYILKTAKKTDDLLFKSFPFFRKYGSFSYIKLTK